MNWSGAGSLALGAASLYNSYSQGKAAESAGNASIAQTNEQLAMAKADRARYEDIYGSLERNMADYYTQLSPSKRAAVGLTRYETEFQDAKKNYTANMAQRGLSGSGIEAEGNMRMNMQAASDKTNIVNDAETNVRNEQLGFLGVGLGQGNIATQNVNNAFNNSAAAYGRQQQNFSNSAAQASQGLGSLIGGASYAYGRDKNVFSGSLF